MLLLTEADHPPFELLQATVATVPVHFRTVLHVQDLFTAIEVTMGRSFPLSSSVLHEVHQRQREHVQATIQAEQSWITTRRTWLKQREEWLSQRHQWLSQRMLWILQQRELPDPQLEWFDEQRDWLACIASTKSHQGLCSTNSSWIC
jgi:hypothetical protein